NDPDFYHPTRSMRVIARRQILPALRPVYDLVASFPKKDWTVIADPFSYGARIAAEKRGLRLITCVVSPFLLRTSAIPRFPGLAPGRWAPQFVRRGFYAWIARLWDRVLGPELNAFRASLGLGPVRDIFYGWS